MDTEIDPDRLLARLADGDRIAEYELDLTGMDRAHAEESVRLMLERNRFTATRSIRVQMDPPPVGGGETLFQPIGRLLLAARRQGSITGLSPLPPDQGLGYRIETAGKPEAEKETEAPDLLP